MTSEIKVDTISENTSANGVAIDGVTIKDGGISATTQLDVQQSTTDMVGLSILNTNNSATTTSSQLRIGMTNSVGASYAVMKVQEGGSDDYPDIIFGVQNAVTTTPTERMRIKDTGEVGIGTSSPSTKLDVAGDTTITKNDTPLYLNRTSSGGEILRFSKDGTARGSIAVSSDGASFGNPTQHIAMHSGILFPSNDAHSALDNTIDLGYSGGRFKNIYLSGGAFIGGTGTANQLDDYEEGTWTPDATFADSEASSKVGKYTKIGNVVIAQFQITFGTTSYGAVISVAGLPFTSNNHTGLGIGGSMIKGYYDGSSTNLSGYIPDNSSQVDMRENHIHLTHNSDKILGKNVRATLVYQVN